MKMSPFYMEGDRDGPVRLYDLARKQELAALGGAFSPTVDPMFFLDDDTIVGWAGVNEVIVWRAASFAEINAAEKADAAGPRR